MLRWFRSAPQCPVDLTDKVWIEQPAFAWLIAKLGVQPMRDLRVVLPTPEFFPDHFDGTEETVVPLFRRVSTYMGLPPDRVELNFFDEMDEEHRGIGAAGYYLIGPPERIVINRQNLGDVESLTATCAHELAHAVLLGDELVSVDAADHEFLTDLTTVFRGLGLFCANSSARERFWSDGNLQYSQYLRLGYLAERAYGYAFALFAWLRGETSPEWLPYLRRNVRAGMEQGLKFLDATGDALISPDTLDDPHPRETELTLAKVREELRSDSPSRRLSMIWQLRRRLDLAERAFEELRISLESSDWQVMGEAMELLRRLGAARKFWLRSRSNGVTELTRICRSRPLGLSGRPKMTRSTQPTK